MTHFLTDGIFKLCRKKFHLFISYRYANNYIEWIVTKFHLQI